MTDVVRQRRAFEAAETRGVGKVLYKVLYCEGITAKMLRGEAARLRPSCGKTARVAALRSAWEVVCVNLL